jgi:cytochrome c
MRLLYAGLLGLVLAGCGPDGGQQAAGDAAPAEPVDINALVASADPNRGQSLYLQCRACHSLEQGGVNKVGPNLHGMFGSKAGFAEGFVYSDAIRGADVVWTPETLNEWLERPSQFLPGNRMIFVGIRRPEDRAAIIAFLERETSIQGP